MNVSAEVSVPDRAMIPLARISTDEDTQTRVKVQAGVVRDYALAMTQQLADGGENTG